MRRKSKVDTVCLGNRFFTNICASGHANVRPLRCNICDGCYNARMVRVRFQIWKRVAENEFQDEVLLWTLGTPWKYTEVRYQLLRRNVTLLFKRIRKLQRLSVLFKVYEIGKNGYLHVHFVTSIQTVLSQPFLRSLWSQICGFQPGKVNVNFSRKKECVKCHTLVDYYRVNRHCSQLVFRTPEPQRALSYCTKYMTKDSQGLQDGSGLKRSYYLGKPLFLSYNVVISAVTNLRGGMITPLISANSNGIHRVYFKYSKKSIFNYEDGSPCYGFNVVISYYNDQKIFCDRKECESPIVIKAIEFVGKKYGLIAGLDVRKDIKSYLIKHISLGNYDELRLM